MVAAEAIKNVSRNLVTSIREPENIEAMSNVACITKSNCRWIR